MLHGIETESKCIGELRLRHVEALSFSLDVNLGVYSDLVGEPLPGELFIHLNKAVLQVFKHGHDRLLYLSKIPSAIPASSLRSAFVRFSFSFFAYAVIRKIGKSSLRRM